MIVTKRYIKQLREKSFMNISFEKEKLILDRFKEGGFVDHDSGYWYEYTEQDIWEQVRKIIQDEQT